ncbi:MAG: methionyl-tRNA formyltransferase [Akkermansiaceae bacterium]|nr:methionyl-tRNA formyltransferase [Armatimonadota bacterium]
MKVLFFGTSSFAVPTLNALYEAASRHEVIAVVTQPDKPSGRGMKLSLSPIKVRAEELGYRVLQPEKVRRQPFPAEVAEMKPDALVVVSFGQIISQSVLDIPRYGGINVHGSLLPRWRGAAPIHWAIMEGDAQTGVATMQMEASLDTGPVYLETREPIRPDDTVGTLEPRLSALGGPLLVETLDRLEAGDITATPQTEDGMTYARPVTRENGFLDPRTEPATQMERKIRALSPRPGAWLIFGDKLVKVLAAEVVPDSPQDAPPGTIAALTRTGVLVATPDGTLLVTRLQPENKAAMSAADYARGSRLGVGDIVAQPSGGG